MDQLPLTYELSKKTKQLEKNWLSFLFTVCLDYLMVA
jgi:hypothetical protein